MTKGSQRRPARYDQSGCMWGFISILDFRHASKSNRKLLADKRGGSRSTVDLGELLTEINSSNNVKVHPPQGNTSGEDSFGEITDTSKPSVKTLIEEEMVTEHTTSVKILDPKSGLKQQDQEHEDQKKKKKSRRRNKDNSSFDMENRVLNLKAAENPITECPCNDKHNVNGIMEEFCNHIYERRRNIKNPENNREKLREVITDFISQELNSGKHLTESGGVNFPQELVNVLQIPNLDEESFVKHLGDPNSLLLKYVQSLEDAHLSKQKSDKVKEPEEGPTSKPRKFFRRNIKNQEESNTIVILKPGPHEPTSNSRKDKTESSTEPLERTSSHFFLTEIKRRWKNVMGKDQSTGTAPNSVTIKSEKSNLGQKSPSRDHFYIEKIARPRKEEKIGTETANNSKKRVPNIYIEAKRHLSEMVNNGIEEVDSSGRKSPKTLARILSLSEFNSPMPSPRWDRDHRSFLTSPRRFSGQREVEKKEGEVVEENKVVGDREPAMVPIVEVGPSEIIILRMSDKLLAANEGQECFSATRDDTTSEGNAELRTTEIIEEECSATDATNVQSSGNRNHPYITLDMNGHVEHLIEEVHFVQQSLPSSVESPPSSSATRKTENLEVTEEKPDRYSPVSVLEPLFTEEDASPSTTSSRSAEQLPIQPLRIKFEDDDTSSEEALVSYIRATLQTHGLNWDELYMNSQSSDQLLAPSLLNSVDLHCTQHDKNLIFDCINEILLEICDRHFGSCPCVLFAGNPSARSVPSMEETVNEVWEGVHWHLVRLAPQTLDKVVQKDMSRDGSWMDLRPDTEIFGLEMADDLLDDLIEETVTVTRFTSGSCPVDENSTERVF